MRLIGIGLLAFLLTGATFLISYFDLWQRGVRQVREMTDGPQTIFEARQSTVSTDPAFEARFLRTGPEETLLLSGFPSFQKAVFPLPRSNAPLAGYLQLDLSTQLVSGSEGTLRVNINGTRRAEVVLRPGDRGKKFRIDLTDADLSGQQIVASLSASGITATAPCGADRNLGFVAEIEPSSAVHLDLAAPLSTPLDTFASWGNVARVAWPDWLSEEDRTRRLALSGGLASAGVEVLFVPTGDTDAFNAEDLRAVLSTHDLNPGSDAQRDWPVFVAKDSPNARARVFRGRTEWRIPFDPQALPDRKRPAALNLSLTLGPTTGEDWTVLVMLNDQLLASRQARSGPLTAQIDLPPSLAANPGTVSVIASTTDDAPGICDAGPERVAQMESSTVLLPGLPVDPLPLDQLRRKLAGFGVLQVAQASTLTPPEATWAAKAFGDLVDGQVRLKPGSDEKRPVGTVFSDPGSISTFTPSEAWALWRDDPSSPLRAAPLSEETQAHLSVRRGPVLVVRFPTEASSAGDAS